MQITHLNPAQAVDVLAVLVEAGGQPDRIGKLDAPDRAAQDRVIWKRRAWHPAALQRLDGEAVRTLRIEAAQDRPDERIEVDHRPQGKTCRPSLPSGSAAKRLTAVSGRSA